MTPEQTLTLATIGLVAATVGRAAVADVAAGQRSTWDAAGRAGVSLYEMLDRVAEAGIPYRLDPEVIERTREAVPLVR